MLYLGRIAYDFRPMLLGATATRGATEADQSRPHLSNFICVKEKTKHAALSLSPSVLFYLLQSKRQVGAGEHAHAAAGAVPGEACSGGAAPLTNQMGAPPAGGHGIAELHNFPRLDPGASTALGEGPDGCGWRAERR